MHLQLLVDRPDVAADGVDADIQLATCSFVAVPFCQQREQADLVRCQLEEQFFNNPSWYDRFGFMYQNFMAEAYRRPE